MPGRDGLKSLRIGQSAAKPRTAERSTTIPAGSRAGSPKRRGIGGKADGDIVSPPRKRTGITALTYDDTDKITRDADDIPTGANIHVLGHTPADAEAALGHGSSWRETYLRYIPTGYIYVSGLSDDGDKLRYYPNVYAYVSDITESRLTYATCSVTQGKVSTETRKFLVTD